METMRRIVIIVILLTSLVVPVFANAGMDVPFYGQIYYALASWYGHQFHGKTTASGEVFDMHHFTCAHRTFPFGTLLRITNMVNNKTTFCVVNDRGPFETVRDLDLSYAAARVLDMLSLGICTVRVEYLGVDATYVKMKEALRGLHFLKAFPSK